MLTKGLIMKDNKLKNKLTYIVDAVMYALLLTQMLYIFTGNTVHEILGISFFVCLVLHLIIKRKWIKAMVTGKLKPKGKAALAANISTVLLFVCCIVLMLSSMGVSRLLFPWFKLLRSSDLHRYLATAVLTLAAFHGGMHFYIRAKKKKKAACFISLACVVCLALGLFGVPYLNRHFKTVGITYADSVYGEKVEWNGKKPLIVYFTRLGNTDFDDDIDAVSGASLLHADGELMGSNQLIADMLEDIIGCGKKAVTLTGKKYPSSYGATVSAASDELDEKARPEIEPIDVSDYDSIILVYPLWWGTAPPAVSTFLESNDFSGKKIYLVATQGSTGFSHSTEDIQESAKGAEVIEALSIYCEDIPDARPKLVEWLKELNG